MKHTPDPHLQTLTEGIDALVMEYFQNLGSNPPPAGLKHKVTHQLEKSLVMGALTKARNNQTQAAGILSIHRNTLLLIMQRSQIRTMESNGHERYRLALPTTAPPP